MNARDELAEVIRGIDGPATIGGLDVADEILAAGYRKLRPIFAETLVNDGEYEYTISSDCDGSSVQHWRRKPKMAVVEDAQPWEAYEPVPATVLYEPGADQ